jgi:hypothetical protein
MLSFMKYQTIFLIKTFQTLLTLQIKMQYYGGGITRTITINFGCTTTQQNDNLTMTGRPKTTGQNDNWTKRQLDQTTTGPNDNWTKRQLDQTTTGPKDNWTKTNWIKKVICAIRF